MANMPIDGYCHLLPIILLYSYNQIGRFSGDGGRTVKMLDEKLPVSLYYQLKEILIKKIKENQWPVNTRIPTERELCELYRVSRITVRQALDELEKEGYLYRKQGRGTFVTVPKLEQRLGSFYSFSEEIRKMGAVPVANIIEFNIMESSDRISGILEIKKGEKVYGIHRLRKADKEPFAIEVSYIPTAIAPGLERESIESDGLYNTLKISYGIVPDEAWESFEAVLVADEKNAGLLGVKKNSAALKIERVTRSKGGVVEYCEGLIRGDRYKYNIVLK